MIGDVSSHPDVCSSRSRLTEAQHLFESGDVGATFVREAFRLHLRTILRVRGERDGEMAG